MEKRPGANEKKKGMKERVGYINPIFQEPKQIKLHEWKKQSNTDSQQPPKKAVRKDKTHNIKFPVSVRMQMSLKSTLKQANLLLKSQGTEPLSQTKFNTLLLRYGLQHPEILKWSTKYQDTKVYMHTNLFETEYDEIGGPHGLSIQKNLSDRKVVFHILLSVIYWMEGEGSVEKII